MSLYIGAHFPDRRIDESRFSEALTRVAAKLASCRQHPLQKASPALDIHFLTPGATESPDFTGMRLHSFDTASATLRIESVVPDKMINSQHAEKFVLAVMQDAVDNAYEFFEARQLTFLPNDYHRLIESLASVWTGT